MNKLKQTKIMLSVAVSALVIVSVLGLGKLALASNLFSWVGVEDKVAQNLTEKVLENAGQPEESLGALTSPEINSRWLKVGGVLKYYVIQTMNTATTSLCSIPNPSGTTTSTLESFDYQITTGTTTAATLVGTISSLQYASSTVTNFAAAQTVASGAQDSFSVTPLIDAGITNPSYFVQLRSEGVGLSGYTYTGKCQAVFRQMP